MFESLSHSYQILEEIGRGKFGAVFRCFSPIRHDFFACKVIDKHPLVDPTDRECLENEPKVMTLLSQHPNILALIDVFDSDDSLCVVTELCQPDSLYDHVVRRLYSEIEAALIVKQLLLALAHCHRLGVVHRDVKPENLLFDSRGNLKLADFGSAVLVQGGMSTEGIVGTPYYVAPEVLMGMMYREKVDVWSAGVIMYIMLSGSPPFNGESVEAVFEAVARGNLRFPPKLFRSISPEAKDLLRKMICRDASKRISAEQALRHPWILSGGETSPMTAEA